MTGSDTAGRETRPSPPPELRVVDPTGLADGASVTEPRATEPPDVTPTTRLRARDSVGKVVEATVAGSVARLLALDAGVQPGDDAELVHQTRVAARRLRSDLRTFGSLLEPEWDAVLRSELRWIGDELGAVRDTDVLLDVLREKVAQLDGPDRAVAGPVLDRLMARRHDARAHLLDSMGSARYAALLDRLLDAARAPRLLPAASTPAGEALPALVAVSWADLRRAVEALAPHPADAALHAVRIRAKRCRYAAEAAAGVVGKRARSFARAVAVVQEVLGAHQDAVVARTWLRDTAADATGAEAFVVGELAGLVRVDEQATRDAWPAAWKAASRKRLRAWL